MGKKRFLFCFLTGGLNGKGKTNFLFWDINLSFLSLNNWKLFNVSLGGFGINLHSSWASLITQLVKNLPAVQEIPVPNLSLAVSLEKG